MDAPALFSYNTLVHAMSGSLASVTAMTTTYPLDNIRAKIQLDLLHPTSSTLKILIRILREHGVEELYRGIGPTLQSQCVSNFVYFYVFHGLKGQIKSKSALKNLFLGALAGVVNVLTTTPLWVVNTRIKLGASYRTLTDGLIKISSTEGVQALWAGTGPSLLLVFNPAIQFMTYESLKRRVKNGNALTVFILGAISKCVATVLTYPLQLVQAKMRHGSGSKSIKQLFMEIIQKNGLSGLYKGMESKILQTVTTAALMFVFYEKIARFVFHLMGVKAVKR